MRFNPIALLVIAVAATPAMGGPIAYAICPPGSSAHNACMTYCFVNFFGSPDP
ncbi:hypothetical protein FIBSPDRAFT_851516 [Athelia psychrophila]|uniref:Uncharacterized protein n=1 Tax=Athelia psychrophila TaxID=1759441 RepID=A0A166SJS5_9AGAM|nr:hypothetical protein FIBSPDRAFT_851516 [Fibularhizoctonia sp. CBS 109695]